MHGLILGGAGFIGSHLSDFLVSHGHSVRILDLKKPQIQGPSGIVDFLQADWNDFANMERALSGVDAVFHLICTTRPATSTANIEADLRDNLLPTIQLLDLCRKHQIKRVVFLSSGGTVYGKAEYLPIKENHPTRPINSYGIVKITIENYLRLYSHLFGLTYTVIRASNAYGKGQICKGAQGFIAAAFNQMTMGSPIEIWGSDQIARDFVHVSDVVTALELAATYTGESDTFNVGTGIATELGEVIRLMSKITGIIPQVNLTRGRLIDVPINTLDNQHARSILGWYPRVTLEDGLRLTWSSLKTSGIDQLNDS